MPLRLPAMDTAVGWCCRMRMGRQPVCDGVIEREGFSYLSRYPAHVLADGGSFVEVGEPIRGSPGIASWRDAPAKVAKAAKAPLGPARFSNFSRFSSRGERKM